MSCLRIVAVSCFFLSNNAVRPDAGPNDSSVHPEHLPYVRFSEAGNNVTHCWGYENGCSKTQRYSSPTCTGPDWSRRDKIDAFYDQADFGYVKLQRQELTNICEPINQDDSSLECTDHLKFCRGRNIMINFANILHKEQPIRYDMDVLTDGQIGGKCKLHKDILINQCDHLSPLQSWSPELRYFASIEQYPGKCDLIISVPTVIMKIDATVNMYHHFCDFLNLYASQHVNNSGISMFSKDIHILIWESFEYKSAFSETFQVFTTKPLWNLNTFKGKIVCFNNIVLPLLPRMIFGLYYNTPLPNTTCFNSNKVSSCLSRFLFQKNIQILLNTYKRMIETDGCQNSGLFKAFSQHVLYRLKIYSRSNNSKKIMITFLSRNTKYRNILNENELIVALKNHPEYEVKKVVYNDNILSFKEQLQITSNTDIFIGIHGAGLTHLLFLPDWAVLFELYNCEDNCYQDLAHLRGVKYTTWQDVNKLTMEDKGSQYNNGARAKFTNYSFDKDEFLKLVKESASYVKLKKPSYNSKPHNEL